MGVRTERNAAALVALLAAGMGAPGCGTTARTTDPDPSAAAAESPAPADPIEKAAGDLQGLFDQLSSDQSELAALNAATGKPSPSPKTGRNSRATASPERLVFPPPPDAPPEPAMDGTSPDAQANAPADSSGDAARAARRAELVRELARLLREGAASPDAAARAALAAEALRLIDPDAAGGEETNNGLSDASIAAVRELLHEVASGAAASNGAGRTASDLAAALRRAADRLSGVEPLDVTARLCARVESFGRYTPLDSDAFLAGRVNSVLVYVEVTNFTHAPLAEADPGDAAADASGDERWVVELGQELNLYHDADHVLAWRQPEEVVRDVARRKRRDYYLVRRVDLPPTLTVGRFNLKVTVRDLATGSIAEAVLPIRIVADARLTNR
ncbi:MAG: hypothetical protein JNM07_04495 [Phycisphaerae bacterium]|nr:hypothetical protein [Phycisphaerae bacterium]